MRSDPHIVCAKAAIESQPPFLLHHLARAIQHTLVRQLARRRIALLLLQPSLDKVKRQREETGEETRDRRSGERLRLRRQTRVLLELGLALGEEGQLTHVQGHRPDDRGQSARPERRQTFLLGDADQRVKDGAVVGASLGRFEAVGLHTHEGQIGRVTDHRGDTAGRETRDGALGKGDLAVLLLGARVQLLDERVKETQTGGSVDGLSEETCRETGVKVHDLAGGDDLLGDTQSGRPGTGAGTFAGELQAHLDHVNGLDYDGGGHAGQAAVDEGEGGAHVGVVQDGGGGCRRVLHGSLGGFLGGDGRIMGSLLDRAGCHGREGSVELTICRGGLIRCLSNGGGCRVVVEVDVGVERTRIPKKKIG